jgi:putative ABC transport system permease protein
MGASNISLLKTKTLLDYLNRYLYYGFHVGTIAFLFLLIVLGIILISYLLSTKFGLRLRVSGCNPEYAKSLGINVSISLIIGLFFTNCLAAFSGILLAMYQGFVDINMGQGTLILALAAMTIGERILPESRFSFHNFVCFSAIVGSIYINF